MTPDQLRQLVIDIYKQYVPSDDEWTTGPGRRRRRAGNFCPETTSPFPVRRKMYAAQYIDVAIGIQIQQPQWAISGKLLSVLADHLALDVADLYLFTQTVRSLSDEEWWAESEGPAAIVEDEGSHDVILSQFLRAVMRDQEIEDPDEAVEYAEGSWLCIGFPPGIVEPGIWSARRRR